MTEADGGLEPAVPGPLAHLRILEVAELVPGPYAGRLLTDLGASVVKVERPPGGDAARQAGPFADDRADPEASGLYTYLNRGKRSVALDWSTPEGSERLEQLLDRSDVLVVDERFGASHGELLALAEAHPRLSVVSITPFGLVGPRAHWRGSSATASAYGGLTLYFGEQDRPPIPTPHELGSFQGGLAVAIASLLCVLAREGPLGRGQLADIATNDVLSTIHTGLAATHWVFSSRQFQRHGRRGAGNLYPNALLRCKDGWFRVHAMARKEWRGLLEMMGNPAWGDDPKYQDRIVNGDKYANILDGYIEGYFLQHTKQELFEQSRKLELPFAPAREMHEIMHEEQLLHRELFETVAHPNGDEMTVAGSPFRWSASDGEGWGARPKLRAPRLGEHTEEVFAALAAPAPAEASPPAAAPSRRGGNGRIDVAEGVRVLDLGMVWAGSICGQVLSDFGADILKIESMANLDIARRGRPIIGTEYDPNQNPLFHNTARNKRSLALNLKTEHGREVLRRLFARVDVLIENWRPGTLASLGLSYDDLRDLNPSLIWVSQTMAGQDGPLARMRAYGPTISSITGLDSLIGYEDEQPLGMAHAYADPNVGLHSALLVLSALERRRRTGEGAFIDVSMWDAMVTSLALPLLDYELNGRVAGPLGDRAVAGAPAGVFPSAGDDKWLVLELHGDDAWAGLVEAMGRPDWALDERYATVEGRAAARDELHDRVAEWTAGRDRDETAELLQDHGVIAAPCLAVSERLFDEHLLAREGFVWVENPALGREPVYGQAIRLSATPGSVRAPAPLLGQHSAEILREVLEMPEAEIDALAREGVLE